MRTLAPAVALCAVATSFVAPAGRASPPVDAPDGRRCSYTVVGDPDPQAPPERSTGQLSGGPLVWDRDFWVHCRLRTGSNSHDGPNVVVAEHRPSAPHDGDAETPEVAVLATRITYESPFDARESLCTAVSWPTPTGPHWLYAIPGGLGDDGVPGTPDDEDDRWSADPASRCTTAYETTLAPVIEPALRYASARVDRHVCAALVAARPAVNPAGSGPQPGYPLYVDAEGDVFADTGGDGISEAGWTEDMWWDCPPYTAYPNPGADGSPVVDAGPSTAPAGAYTAVAGYVTVAMNPGDAAPTYTLAGELAVPARWTCAATPYVMTQPFTVSCTPVGPAALVPECEVVHADVTTTTANGVARAALHCDSHATPEAKTHAVTGVGGHDSTLGPLLWPVTVTQFRCTVSNGLGGAPVPGFVAACGDPGAARVGSP